MHHFFRNWSVLVAMALTSLVSNVFAAAPGLINYQGRLTDGAGIALNGNYSLTFNVYSLAVGGVPLWTETQNPVVVDEGLFNVLLGSVAPLNEAIFSEANRFIGVQVNGGAELAPRKQIVAVAYALTVATIDGASGGHVIGDSRFEGNVVIGTGDALGTLSFTAGANNTAQGNYSTAMGADNSASGHYSNVSGGLENIASGAGAGIGGGSGNLASGDSSFVGAGSRNIASGSRSFIGGGRENLATGDYSHIGGGWLNYTESLYSTVGGGERDSATAQWATVAGGRNNDAEGGYSTIGGGTGNRASGTRAFIGGGVGNLADGFDAIVVGGEYCSTLVSGGFVGGGDQNSVSGSNSVIVGGFANKNSGYRSMIGGGTDNVVTGDTAVVVGGILNVVSSSLGNVVGGYGNSVTGRGASILGGSLNLAEGEYSFVGGGVVNRATGAGAVISGGSQQKCWGTSCVIGGGGYNTADSGASNAFIGGGQNNWITDQFGGIVGGEFNSNRGAYSVILGGSLNSISDELLNPANYIVVFGEDVDVGGADHRSYFFDGTNPGRLALNRDTDDGGALHPIHVGTANTNGNGARLTNAGVWTDASSRTFKENFVEIGGAELLDKISQLSLPHYNYKGTTEKHIGPMAEDFVALFNVGSVDENTGQIDPMYLSAKDVAGVALAGVKELSERNRELQEQVQLLLKRIENLESNKK